MQLCVGLDLAWAARARTGLAAVDESGRLVASGAVVSDEEIDTWLAGLDGTLVAVGIDAPIVVPNATGQRPSENLVQRAYGRYGAGPYPSNRANPLFDPPRAGRLAERHGWTTDLARTGTPRRPVCLETFPHPAMVNLFGFERVLPYKARKGRTPDARRLVFLQLLGHLEHLEVLGLAANQRWSELRTAVEQATRQVHLERVEDELDAILCAHLAWLWQHEPSTMEVFGEPAEGAIVIPRRIAFPA